MLRGLKTVLSLLLLALLLWTVGAGIDRVLFVNGDRFGAVQKRFIANIPPGACASLAPTDHVEWRISHGAIEYRCGYFGPISFWPFYDSFENQQIPAVVERILSSEAERAAPRR